MLLLVCTFCGLYYAYIIKLDYLDLTFGSCIFYFRSHDRRMMSSKLSFRGPFSNFKNKIVLFQSRLFLETMFEPGPTNRNMRQIFLYRTLVRHCFLFYLEAEIYQNLINTSVAYLRLRSSVKTLFGIFFWNG